MLPVWILALPIWLVVFKYREVRKFLAGAFFVSSGTCWYLWVTGVSFPVMLPYVGTVSVETPEISGQRAIVHFIRAVASAAHAVGRRATRRQVHLGT